MLVRSSSPAPNSHSWQAQAIGSRPVTTRAPWVSSSHPSPRRRASIATTTHWDPKSWAASWTRPGLETAAVWIETLSAPARRSSRISEVVRTPPPAVSGMNTCRATLATKSTMVARPSGVASMSRKTSSSAPSRAYWAARLTGSPWSNIARKWSPLTTRRPATSRQGMIRLVSMGRAWVGPQSEELAEQANPVPAAALGMELHPSDGLLGDRTDEASPVLSPGADQFLCAGLHHIRVTEVEIAALQAGEERRGPGHIDGVPADVGQFLGGWHT